MRASSCASTITRRARSVNLSNMFSPYLFPLILTFTHSNAGTGQNFPCFVGAGPRQADSTVVLAGQGVFSEGVPPCTPVADNVAHGDSGGRRQAKTTGACTLEAVLTADPGSLHHALSQRFHTAV